MLTKSPSTWLLHRLALLSALLIACFSENASAQTRPFINISTRAEVLGGGNIIVAGFIIQTTATTTKQVLIRGMGPSYGLSLADPTITLYGPNGAIYSNNNWKDDVNQQNAIAATGMQPGNDLESAILWNLPAGSYTVTLGSGNGGTGIGLVELYDMGGAAPIVNLSSRAQVGTGDNALIGGVYAGDNTRAVVRAIGPTLANYGIQGALTNPMLELYNAQGSLMASNDDWGTDGAAAEIQRLGLQPANGYESAILPTLAPGPYTVVVRGFNNTTGIGMVELYALEDAAYPRIFQNWANAYNPDNPSEDPMVTVARHDLFWTTLNGFGLSWSWEGNDYAEDYRSETLVYHPASQAYDIATLRTYNPRIKILGQIQHYSASRDTGPEHLPSSSPWWKKINGQFVQDPLDSSRYLLDQDNPDLRAHVATLAKALMDTGNFDGIMLDSCDTGTTYLYNLLTDIRAKIGENALIIVNVNSSLLSTTELSKINGVFMECGKIGTGNGYPDWPTVMAALNFNEANARPPKVNCLQDWYSTSPTNATDLKRMRAITTLGLTHSNGYVNFGNDEYYWYSFWSGHSLGVPIVTTGQLWNSVSTYGHRRDFKNGSAIWNSSTATSISVTFSQTRKSLATGAIKSAGQTFSIAPADGDIFLSTY